MESSELPSELGIKILNHLSKGRDSAIKGKELARLLGYSNDRKIREEIAFLIQQGFPVASTTEPPYGFFICDSKTDAESYLQTLRSRAIEDFHRMKHFKSATHLLRNPEQKILL